VTLSDTTPVHPARAVPTARPAARGSARGRARGTAVASAALLALLASAPATAQQAVPPQPPPPVPASALDDIAFVRRLSTAFKGVASAVEPSVVHITSIGRQRFRRSVFDPVQERLVPTGLGSGFIVSKDGLIVTNNHVVGSAEGLQVRLSDGREFEATVVGRDQATDLAVIRLTLPEIPPALRPVSFADSDSIEVGEWVIAIGSPFGLSNTVTQGIVSAKGRSITPRETGRNYEDFIQTDAAINPGNSGGPLLSLEGQVVGVNSAIATRSGGYEGIGFAIPSNIARAVMENIIANGRVVRGFLGVEMADAAPEQLGSLPTPGVLIRRVEPDSPAGRAGLRAGDVITRFQGRPFTEARLRTAIALTPPGTRTQVEILRDGVVQTVVVALGDFERTLASASGIIEPLGIRVQAPDPDSPGSMGGPARGVGLLVTEVDPEGRASELQPGDLITGVELGDRSKEVRTAEDLIRTLRSADLEQGCRLRVIRGKMRGYVDIRG